MMGCNPQQTFQGSTNFFSQARTALNAASKIQALPDRNFRCRDGFQSHPKSLRINDFRINVDKMSAEIPARYIALPLPANLQHNVTVPRPMHGEAEGS